jgi:hypothetical protein
MAESAVYPIAIEKLPFKKYIELPGEHSTGLRRMLISPLEYDHYKRAEHEDTDALVIGRAAHTATLEPHQFLREFALWEGGVRRGKDWDRFEADNAAKTILREQEYTTALAIAEAIRAHPVAGPLFAGPGRNELSLQWRHESGALCKARIDRLTPTALIDIKTAADITPDAFERQSYKLGYHVQAAFYRDAVKTAFGATLPVLLVVAAKKAPFDVVVREVDLAAIDAGREAYERALAQVAECTKLGKWPGLAPVEALPLRLPTWAMPNFDEEAAESINFGSEVIQ